MKVGVASRLAALALAVAAWPCSAKQATPSHGPADSVGGVIVQLRDAMPHVGSLHKGSPQLVKGVADARYNKLKAELGLQWSAKSVAADLQGPPHMVPVGASAALLKFDRRLRADEAQRLVEQIQQHPDVVYAVANSREMAHQSLSPGAVGAASSFVAPNDPLFAGVEQQWWLQAVGGSDANRIERRLRGVPGFMSAWPKATGSVTVAILDTGVTSHPELDGRILPGYDFVSDWDVAASAGYANDGDGRDADPSDPGDGLTQAARDADPLRYSGCPVRDSTWHGTIIAGMLVGQTGNQRGVASMLWNARIVPVRVAGRCGADVADIVDGMRWAAGLPVAGAPLNPNPARIINMSFGGDASCNAAYVAAITDLAQAPGGGALLVASAGNRWGPPSRPSNCPGALGVTALNRDGFKSNYASFGSTVSIATVGGDDRDGAWGPWLADSGLLTITNLGTQAPGAPGYARVYGTSFAAPLVSGTLALMLSVNPELSLQQLKAGLAASARPHVSSPYLPSCTAKDPGRCACTQTTCGAGILDVDQALLYAQAPTTYVPPAAQGAVLDNAELRAAAASGPDREPNTMGVSVVNTSAEAATSGAGHLAWPWALALLSAIAALRRRPWAPSLWLRKRQLGRL